MSRITMALLVLLTAAVSLPAQVFYDVNLSGSFPTTTSSMQRVNLPSQLFPSGAIRPGPPPVLSGFVAAMNGSLQGIPIQGLGGVAIDEAIGAFYATDGTAVLSIEPHPGYPASTVHTQSTSLFALLLELTLTDVTGMTFDVSGRRLFMVSSSGSVAAFSAATFPPTYISGSTISVPGFSGGSLRTITGLGWEASTGTLWATSSTGGIYNFSTSGAPVGGGQPVLSLGLPLGSVTGMAVNRTNGPGSTAPITTNYHVAVSDGATVYDATGAGVSIAMGPLPVGVVSIGLAGGSGDLQYLAASLGATGANQASPSASSAAPISLALNRALLGAGSPPVASSVPLTMTLTGAAPGTPAVIMFDLSPVVPGIVYSGGPNFDTILVNPFSPTLLTFTMGTSLVFPLDPMLMVQPAGLTRVAQAFIADPLNAPWLVTGTPVVSFVVARP